MIIRLHDPVVLLAQPVRLQGFSHRAHQVLTANGGAKSFLPWAS
jgi:hypothetical protein